jgi:hypothetical protein
MKIGCNHLHAQDTLFHRPLSVQGFSVAMGVKHWMPRPFPERRIVQFYGGATYNPLLIKRVDKRIPHI